MTSDAQSRTVPAELESYPEKADGPVSAALIAGGIGAFALGVLTTAAEASTDVKDFLNYDDDVGPLSGKTTYAVAIWLVSWLVLHLLFRRRGPRLNTALTISLVLIALGVLGTFPTFFQAFTSD